MFKGSDNSANRSDEFKTGLGTTEDAAKRHADKAISLRREKREDKIQRMRNRNHCGGANAFELSNVIAMRDAFIATRSYESSQFLKHFMHVSEAEAINEILCVPLVEACIHAIAEQNHPPAFGGGTSGSGVMCNAADCLVNIAADIDNAHIPAIGKAIFARPAFYAVMNQHLCNKDSPIRHDMWKVLANMACMCQDARNVMLQSIVFVAPSTGNALPIFASEFDKRDASTLPILLVLLMGVCASPDAVIPEAFMMAHWRRIVNLLPFFLPEPQREEQPMEVLEYTLTIIQKTLEKSSEQRAVQMVAMEPPAVAFMVGLCRRVSGVNFNVLRVQRILVMLSKYNTPGQEFLHAMRNAGCIPLMTELSVNANERIQKEALMWIGNYAAEGPAFVKHLLDGNAFDGIIGFLRRAPKQHVLDQALYVLVAAVKACCPPRPSGGGDNNILQTLITHKQFINFTVRHVGQVGCDTRTCDILSMWVALLKWNRKFVQPILEETHGLERVDDLLGSQNVAIYKLASQVDDIVHSGRGGMMDTMDD